MKVFVIAAQLCLFASCNECDGTSGSCVTADEKLSEETSLLQTQHVLKHATNRSLVAEAANSSASTVENTEHTEKKFSLSGSGNKAANPGVFAEPDPAMQPDTPVLVEANSTATIQDFFMNEIEFELGKTKYEVQTVNKVILVLLEVFGCGCCGIDRCFMGQVCCGTIKGITFGGFLIWYAIDYIVVIINALTSDPSIDCIGFVAVWTKDSINTAFIIAIVGLFVNLCTGGGWHARSGTGPSAWQEQFAALQPSSTGSATSSGPTAKPPSSPAI